MIEGLLKSPTRTGLDEARRHRGVVLVIAGAAREAGHLRRSGKSQGDRPTQHVKTGHNTHRLIANQVFKIRFRLKLAD